MDFQKIFKNYSSLDFSFAKIEDFWDWLINNSYKITLKNWEKYFLQKINTNIFQDLEALENNLNLAFLESDKKNFWLISALKNNFWKIHTKLDFWVFRIFPFVEWKCFNKIDDEKYIFQAAKKFAELSEILTEKSQYFQDTIKNFHNLEMRFENFKKTLEKNFFPERMEKSRELIDFILKNEKIVEKSKYFIEKIPKRVFHHDAKINNILFEKDSYEVKSIVDLDTLMSWYIFSDFWDLVWTLVFGIDHKNPEKTYFDEKKYNLLVDWYLSWFKNISEIEIEAMHFWGIYISFMLSIRFLDDFLSWDKYFKIDFENQNFLRAKYQLEIVKDLQNKKTYTF